MKIEFTESLAETVILEALEPAGRLGQHYRRAIAWQDLQYTILDTPGAKPDVENLRSHVLPGASPGKTIRSPSNISALVRHIKQSALAFVFFDFAMPGGHPRIPRERSFEVQQQRCYLYDPSVDSDEHLILSIKAATSWEFLCVGTKRDLTCTESLIARPEAFVFGIHAGDTYLWAARPTCRGFRD